MLCGGSGVYSVLVLLSCPRQDAPAVPQWQQRSWGRSGRRVDGRQIQKKNPRAGVPRRGSWSLDG